MANGIVFITQGPNARQQTLSAINTLRLRGTMLPILCVGDRPLDPAWAGHIYAEDRRDDPGARRAKVNLDSLSPFDCTLYMDADTRVVGDGIDAGFEMLADGWELVITPSHNQNDDWLWHVADDERQETEATFGGRIVVLQGGVFWFRKCEATARLFAAWRDEWERYRGQDQAALLRAMKQAPCKTYLLGWPFNGGSVVKHLHGWARREAA